MAKFKEEKGRIFQNPFLEIFTRTSPLLSIVFYGPLIIIPLILNFKHGYLTNPLVIVGIFLTGALTWTLTEYCLHRFLFHWINDSPLVQRFHFMIHGIHHNYPRDKERLFMPPLPGLVIATIMITTFYLAMGRYIYAFFPGFVTGYLTYAFTHYFIHSRKPPKAFRYLWKHHNIHHYKYPDKAFGVSSPLWDYVFGTMPPENKR